MFQRWLWQVGVLQRAFPNSILRLDARICTLDEVDVHRLLSCRELRDVLSAPRAGLTGSSGKQWPLWAGYMAAACSWCRGMHLSCSCWRQRPLRSQKRYWNGL